LERERERERERYILEGFYCTWKLRTHIAQLLFGLV